MQDSRIRLTIRTGNDALSFSVGNPQSERKIVYEPYHVKNGISIAANLREAFNESELLQTGYRKVLILTDTPVMLVPTDEFDENNVEMLYEHTFTGQEGSLIVHSVLPTLNAVAAFAVNKDLKLVVDDHFEDIRFIPSIQPVWQHLHRRNGAGPRQKLFTYFHEKRMEVFCFTQNRFKFYNSYDATYIQDALYYLLYAWKQLGFHAENDELHIVGQTEHKDWMTEQLHQYLQRVYSISPAADFNRPVGSLENRIPYDLLALYLD